MGQKSRLPKRDFKPGANLAGKFKHLNCQIGGAILQVWYKDLLDGVALGDEKVRFRNGAKNQVTETGLQMPLGYGLHDLIIVQIAHCDIVIFNECTAD